MELSEYKAGEYKQKYEHQSFLPELINHSWQISDGEVQTLLSEADRVLGELNAFSQLVPDVDFFIQMHIIKEATQSSRIEGTRTNMEEVLSNLISNAIRYTPENGKIEVWAEQTEECAMLHVADTGFGIPEESLDQIWDKFFRVKNEKTRYINGTGLGLSIVKRIVEAHHGSIQVDSKVDRGTTFTICLPKTAYPI